MWRQHFITCTDEKRWKIGKRKAESRNTTAETLAGANLFFAIQAVPADSSGDQTPPPINQALLYVSALNLYFSYYVFDFWVFKETVKWMDFRNLSLA